MHYNASVNERGTRLAYQLIDRNTTKTMHNNKTTQHALQIWERIYKYLYKRYMAKARRSQCINVEMEIGTI